MRRGFLLCVLAASGSLTACSSCRGPGTIPGNASPSPTPVTLHLEEDGSPGEATSATPTPTHPKVSFSELYDKNCPRIAKRVLACASEDTFAEALLVHIGRSSRKVVLKELKGSFARWKRAGPDQTCESWRTGFYNAPMLSDTQVLSSVSDAARGDCRELGSTLAESGGLPELIPAR